MKQLNNRPTQSLKAEIDDLISEFESMTWSWGFSEERRGGLKKSILSAIELRLPEASSIDENIPPELGNTFNEGYNSALSDIKQLLSE